jgi:hypothetical protein
LHRPFPPNVPMLPSSALAITSDGECLMCSCLSLGKTICPGSFEFIANYFRGLSLSPRRGNSRTAFVGSIHSGAPSPQRDMIQDSTEEFLMVSSGEGGTGLPAPAVAITTTPWMENALATQATLMVPLWTMPPWPDWSYHYRCLDC